MSAGGAARPADDDRAHFPSLSLLRHTEAAVINSGSTLPERTSVPTGAVWV